MSYVGYRLSSVIVSCRLSSCVGYRLASVIVLPRLSSYVGYRLTSVIVVCWLSFFIGYRLVSVIVLRRLSSCLGYHLTSVIVVCWLSSYIGYRRRSVIVVGRLSLYVVIIVRRLSSYVNVSSLCSLSLFFGNYEAKLELIDNCFVNLRPNWTCFFIFFSGGERGKERGREEIDSFSPLPLTTGSRVCVPSSPYGLWLFLDACKIITTSVKFHKV